MLAEEACYMDTNTYFYKKTAINLNSIYKSVRRWGDMNCGHLVDLLMRIWACV